jgi:hypothetical protein
MTTYREKTGLWEVLRKIQIALFVPLVLALIGWGLHVNRQMTLTEDFRVRALTDVDGEKLAREIDEKISMRSIEAAKIQTMLEDIRSRLAKIEAKLDS